MFAWLAKAFNSLFGGSGDTAGKVAEVVDEAVYTNQEKAKDSADDLASARAFQPGEHWNTFVDKWHRAIRPAFATWAFAILVGVLPPPDHWNKIPAAVWQIILLIITFYFGGRAIAKDLLPWIASMRKK